MDQWEIEVSKRLSVLAAIYRDKEINVPIYLAVLKRMGLTIDQIDLACNLWLDDPNNIRFPYAPAQLKALVLPDHNTEGEAQLIADRIWTAVSFGTDPHGEEKAKRFIDSDLGWAVVQNAGGWDTLNRSVTNVDQAGMCKAHWRKAIVEMMAKKKRGEDLTPRLTRTTHQLKELGVEMKEIPWTNE